MRVVWMSELSGFSNYRTVIRCGPVRLGMADDKQGRDKQADDQIRRQGERDLKEARSRADEPEPVQNDPTGQLGDLDEALADHDYPTTTDELVEAYGDYEVETRDGLESLEDVLSSTDDRTYDSADDVRARLLGLVQR